MDTCIDCGAICEDTRCRQCWAKEVIRFDAAMRAEVGFDGGDAAREMVGRRTERRDAVAEAERIMGIA